jgi:hypothetical protein
MDKNNESKDFGRGLGWTLLFIFFFPIMLPILVIGMITNAGSDEPLFHSKLWRNTHKKR